MKVQLPVVNHASGTTGNLIFQTYRGRTYARALPTIFHYPNTPAQQIVQGKFYNIMQQYRQIFRVFQKITPKPIRQKCNIFDTYAKGIFQAAGTYSSDKTLPPPRYFGTDRQQQCKISAIAAEIHIEKTIVKISVTPKLTLWRRRFVPNLYNLLLVNATQQTLMMITDIYGGGEVGADFYNAQDWRDTDTIHIYLMLSNSEFLSNFYLMQQ